MPCQLPEPLRGLKWCPRRGYLKERLLLSLHSFCQRACEYERNLMHWYDNHHEELPAFLLDIKLITLLAYISGVRPYHSVSSGLASFSLY